MAPAALLETDIFVKTLSSSQDDAQFWSSILTPQLHTLLEAANYHSPSSLIQNINNLLQDYKALGPSPSSKSPWPSFLSDDHSPIEYSVSIAPDRMIVRFAFEPVSGKSGTEGDMWNCGTTTKWLTDTVENYPYDLEWYHILRKHLMIDSSSPPKSNPTTRSQNLTQQVFAFDLDRLKPRLKIYMMPDALVRQSNAEQWISRRDEVITDALNATGLGKPWGSIREYLAPLEAEKMGYVEALGWDAERPEVARQKAYVRFSEAGLGDLERHLDLGGLLGHDERIREIKMAAREMWSAFVEGSGGLGFESIEDLKGRTGGALLAYELRLGCDVPVSVKFYFPVRYHFSSDFTLAQRIDDFLVEKMGREKGWYKDMMERYCTQRLR